MENVFDVEPGAECELCEAPATTGTMRGDYCAECAAEIDGPNDYSERMEERRQMGIWA